MGSQGERDVAEEFPQQRLPVASGSDGRGLQKALKDHYMAVSKHKGLFF